MPVIGTFSPVSDGYTGTIRTLTVRAKVRILANDAKSGPGAPDYRVLIGQAEVGVAWRKTKAGSGESYLSVKLDDPTLPHPIWGALFDGRDSGAGRLVWRRDHRTAEA